MVLRDFLQKQAEPELKKRESNLLGEISKYCI